MELAICDKFLIFSNQSKEDDSVAIIGRHIEEFGEIVYEKGHQLIVQQECNRLLSVYLTHLHDDCDLSDTIETIVKFIDKKRDEEDEIVKIKSTSSVVKSNNTKLEELRAGKLENQTPPMNHKIPFTFFIFVAFMAMICIQQFHLTKDIHAIRYHNNSSESHDGLSLEQLETMENTLQKIVSLQKDATKDLIILQEVVNKSHQAMRKQNELDVKDINELFITTNNLVKTKSDAIKSSLKTHNDLLLNNQGFIKEQQQSIGDMKNILFKNSTLKALEARLETLQEILIHNQESMKKQNQSIVDMKNILFKNSTTLKALEGRLETLQKILLNNQNLSCQSPDSHSKLESKVLETNSKQIEIEEFSSEDFKNFIAVLQGNHQNIKVESIPSLLVLAERYDIPIVSKNCETFLIQNVANDDKIVGFIKMAEKYNLEKLLTQCVDVMAKESDHIFDIKKLDDVTEKIRERVIIQRHIEREKIHIGYWFLLFLSTFVGFMIVGWISHNKGFKSLSGTFFLLGFLVLLAGLIWLLVSCILWLSGVY